MNKDARLEAALVRHGSRVDHCPHWRVIAMLEAEAFDLLAEAQDLRVRAEDNYTHPAPGWVVSPPPARMATLEEAERDFAAMEDY